MASECKNIRDLEATTVYVHGIGVQPEAGVWKGQWDLALFGRPMGSRTKGAYWADLIHNDDEKRASVRSVSEDDFSRYADWLEGTSVDLNDTEAAEFCDELGCSITGQRNLSDGSAGAERNRLPIAGEVQSLGGCSNNLCRIRLRTFLTTVFKSEFISG